MGTRIKLEKIEVGETFGRFENDDQEEFVREPDMICLHCGRQMGEQEDGYREVMLNRMPDEHRQLRYGHICSQCDDKMETFICQVCDEQVLSSDLAVVSPHHGSICRICMQDKYTQCCICTEVMHNSHVPGYGEHQVCQSCIKEGKAQLGTDGKRIFIPARNIVLN